MLQATKDHHFDILILTQQWPFTTCLDWQRGEGHTCRDIGKSICPSLCCGFHYCHGLKVAHVIFSSSFLSLLTASSYFPIPHLSHHMLFSYLIFCSLHLIYHLIFICFLLFIYIALGPSIELLPPPALSCPMYMYFFNPIF